MKQFIAFIPVDNDLDLGRNDFENVNNAERLNSIKSLRGIGVNVRIYNISDTTHNTLFLSLPDFITDYNDEELDGGFWAIDFTCESEQKLEQFLYEEKPKDNPTSNINVKHYKIGGTRGRYFVNYTEDDIHWKVLPFQYKKDAKRFEKSLQAQGYTLLSNIKKYLDEAIETENGTVYKREDYATAGNDEIIYISEYGLNDLEELYENNQDLTDAELVEKQIASTKNSIHQTIKDYWTKATDEWIDKHDLIDDVFQSCTWEYAATMIDQMGDWDIWDDYPEEE